MLKLNSRGTVSWNNQMIDRNMSPTSTFTHGLTFNDDAELNRDLGLKTGFNSVLVTRFSTPDG